jgi:hypothetical protein
MSRRSRKFEAVGCRVELDKAMLQDVLRKGGKAVAAPQMILAG